MQNFCIAYRSVLSKNDLYATGTTGRLIEEASNLTDTNSWPDTWAGNSRWAL